MSMKTNILSFNEREELLFGFLLELFKRPIPLVLRGNLSTRLYLHIENSEYYRETVDIDMDCIMPIKDIKELIQVFQECIDAVNSNLCVVLTRVPIEGKTTAGFSFKEKTTNEQYFTIDLALTRIETLNIIEVNGVNFKTVDILETLVDKVSTCSSYRCIGRRFKDLIDLFSIVSCYSFKIKDISSFIKTKYSELDSFETLYNSSQEDFNNVFSKFKGLHGEFYLSDILGVVRDFCMPIKSNTVNGFIWDCKKLKWINEESMVSSSVDAPLIDNELVSMIDYKDKSMEELEGLNPIEKLNLMNIKFVRKGE